MQQTRSLEGLCHAVVTVTLLLTFSVRSWGQTRLDHAPVGSPAAAEAARARGGPAQPAACRDTTPHDVTFVEVEPGVRLEVLDWGGADKPRTLVLLTGLGDNAHVYDGFAFQFTDEFHVLGITRRGYLPSSQPEDGYDVKTRARDDIAVLDALGIDKATFVGHSIAGSELSQLGEVYNHRVEQLVYLDAVDRAEAPSQPPLPVFTDADAKSLWAFQAASARLLALRIPDPALCLQVIFDANGVLVGNTTPDWVRAKLFEGASANPPVTWARIKAPRLGIFALFTLEARQPYYWYLTADEQAAFDAAWPSNVAWHEETIGKFAEGNSAHTFLLPGAPHYVYLTNEAEVVRWMRPFLGLPMGGE